MRQAVTHLLGAIGYTVSKADAWLLDLCIEKVRDTIRNSCNIDTIPDGLHETAVSMAAGEFLLAKKASFDGEGGIPGLDLSMPVSQIKEGDTSISYAVGANAGGKTAEQRLDELIAQLIGRKADLLRYRRLVW